VNFLIKMLDLKWNILKKTHFILNHVYQEFLGGLPHINYLFSKPTQISLCINWMCNLKCKQCYIWKSNVRGISFEEIKKILVEMRNWLGPFHLTITGGEPLLRDDISNIIKFSSDLGIVTNLITNGVLLNKSIVEKLHHSGLNLLIISIDGPEKIHDFVRGYEGAYYKILNNIKYAKNRLKIRIATIILKQNLDYLVELIKWTEENKFSGIIFQPLQQSFNSGKYVSDWHSKSELWPDNYKKVDNVINSIMEMKKKGFPIINSQNNLNLIKLYFKNPKYRLNARYNPGISSFQIDVNKFLRIGMLKIALELGEKDNIKKIWNSKKVKELRKSVNKNFDPMVMLNCNYKKSFLNKLTIFLRKYA